MSNLYSDGNLAIGEILDREVGLLLGDRAFLGNHPALVDLGDVSQSGSAKKSKDYMGLGLGVMSEVAENGAVGLTDYDFDRISATVSRRSFGRKVSNFLASLDPSGRIRNPLTFAADAVGILQNTLMELLIAAGVTFTNDVTPGSGTNLDWVTLRAAKHVLVGANNNVQPGSVLAVIHNQQWADLENDMASAGIGDAVAHTPEGYNALLARSIGYQGRYFGMDIFSSNRVPTANAGADRRGFMIAPGGLAHAKSAIAPDPTAMEIILQNGALQVEFERKGREFAKEVFFNALLGVAKGLDDAGVTVTSDA